MIITTPSARYKISWQYSFAPIKGTTRNELHLTEAFVEVYPLPLNGEESLAGVDAEQALVGIAKRHPLDKFEKAKGRVISLTHAISSLPQEEREAIWTGLWEKGVRRP